MFNKDAQKLIVYIPYGLRVVLGRGTKDEAQYIAEGLVYEQREPKQILEDVLWSFIVHDTKVPCEEATPILKPLIDIVKPLTYNGDTFVPAEKLWRVAEGYQLPFPKYEELASPEYWYTGEFEIKEFQDSGVQVVHIIPSNDLRESTLEIQWDKTGMPTFYKSFGTTSSDKENPVYGVGNQYYLYDCLIEWGFDILGLIDSGSAIDYNTIKLKNEKAK